jgi:signal transduction histidine kinase
MVPSELLRAGRNDSTFVFTVSDARGRMLYASGDEAGPGAFERHQPMDELLSGLDLNVQILPEAESSILGGSFRSRLPLLMTLLAFTLGVAAFAIYLIKRESELAALRDNFVAGVSHELRTPLAQIRMFAETLRLGRVSSPADRRRSLEIIDHESRRLAHLVENVLQFARSGRGAIRLRLESADMAADVRAAIHAFAVLHRSPDVEVRAELQEGIVANVDRDSVRQILLNLLENAAKYGPLTQRITVGMALIGSHVRLWVDDEGVGVPPAERERVFEAFYRLSRDANSAVGGSGIGLSIVRELARAHGGACRIEDAPGGGARVIVEFPDARLHAGSGSAVA